MDSDQESSDAISQATQTVEHVFRAVYEEFRLWKRDYAARVLDAVAHPPSRIETMVEPATAGPEHITSTEPPATPLPTREFIDFFDYDTETTQRVPIEVYRAPDSFPPLPAYEYWTPNARNIFHGDDPDDLPYIPFADDPTFDHARFLREYSTFSWEEPPVDPDLEVVVLEAARRLHTDHHMLYHHIDETAVLPLELLDRDGARGMLYKSQQCDFPDWPPGVPHSAKRLKTDTAPLPNSPDNVLALLTETFCINLNCTVGFCSTHHDPTPTPLTVPPLVKSDRMNGLAGTPCGDDCFLLKSSGDEPIQWSVDDTQLLCTILDFSPDTLPCDLGVVCAKPCYEVFEQRKTIVPDDTIKRPKPKAKKGKLTRNDSSLDSKQFTPGTPCRHDGPCDASTQCVCYLNNKAYCESGCRCSRKCARRWPGCNCSSIKRHDICRTKSCACFIANRECDPEICRKCQAKDAQANLCRNADIQRAKWKRTKVAPARWGMGLFIAETAAVGHLIIEYVGELVYDPTTLSREPIAQHRGRNYVFELNNTMSIDSTYVGNDARYINHDAQTSNCAAKVCLVNGEHRIGIYATRQLAPGEELLMNYGDSFFQAKDGGSQPHAGPSK